MEKQLHRQSLDNNGEDDNAECCNQDFAVKRQGRRERESQGQRERAAQPAPPEDMLFAQRDRPPRM